MKLHFESNLDSQLAAIESICDLFRGQVICGPSSPSRGSSGAVSPAASRGGLAELLAEPR